MLAPVQSWIDMGSVDLQTEEAWASVLCAFITVGAAGWLDHDEGYEKQAIFSFPAGDSCPFRHHSSGPLFQIRVVGQNRAGNSSDACAAVCVLFRSDQSYNG